MANEFKELSKNITKILNKNHIKLLANDLGFVRRQRKVHPLDFLFFCIDNADRLCTEALTSLCATYSKDYNVNINPQGLNDKFNKDTEVFLKSVLESLLLAQKEILHKDNSYEFSRVRIADSTGFKLPIQYLSEYPGTGSADSPMASAKVQLEYDLLSGEFLNYEISSGTKNDAVYLDNLFEKLESNELCLRDLGYYKLTAFDDIDKSENYYISRLKSYSVIYSKDYRISENKKLVPSENKEYRRLYIDQIIDSLSPGETIDLGHVLIGDTQKLDCRLIIYKLTEKQQGVKKNKIKNSIQKKSLTNSYNTQKFSEINAYITNVPKSILKTEDVHEMYSLRWQIELMFKIWKSVFKINQNKKVKLERFHCALYANLIKIVLSNIIFSKIKKILSKSHGFVVSEMIGFKIIKEYWTVLKQKICISQKSLTIFLNSLFLILKRYGKKSKRKKKKLASDILENVKKDDSEITNLPA